MAILLLSCSLSIGPALGKPAEEFEDDVDAIEEEVQADAVEEEEEEEEDDEGEDGDGDEEEEGYDDEEKNHIGHVFIFKHFET